MMAVPHLGAGNVIVFSIYSLFIVVDTQMMLHKMSPGGECFACKSFLFFPWLQAILSPDSCSKLALELYANIFTVSFV